MSGPKVVRIVTREERIAICQGLLARLDAALGEWERVGRRNDTVTDEDARAMRSRYMKLTEALEADRFEEVQQEAGREAQFVQADQDQRLAAAVEGRKRSRLTRQRTRMVAAELQAALGANGKAPVGSITDAQRSLAEKLKESGSAQSYEQWLSANAPLDGLEQRFAEVSVLLEDADVVQFENRLRALEEEPSQSRQDLLRDSLTVELTKAVREARNKLALVGRLRALSAELNVVGTDSARGSAESLLSSLDGDSAALAQVEAAAIKILEAEREAFAAHMRRRAVLNGLASLGYQVNEGLETAWVQAGRLVIKRPPNRDTVSSWEAPVRKADCKRAL